MVLSKAHRANYVRWQSIMSSAVALSVVVVSVKTITPAEAKTPGKTYCYHGVCHRVKTLAETEAMIGEEETVIASHYDDCSKDRFNPCGLTSSGEVFRPNTPDNTASPIYPDGTKLLVWNPKTQQALVVRVNNAGPYHRNRRLDLSRAAAAKLGFEGQGVAEVRVRVVEAPTPEEAKYSEKRNYAPVPGDIGTFASFEEANTGMRVALAALENNDVEPSVSSSPTVVASLDDDLGFDEAPQVFGRSGFGDYPVTTHRRVARFDLDHLFEQTPIGEDHLAQTKTSVASLGIGSPLYQSLKGDPPAGAPTPPSDTIAAGHVVNEPSAADTTKVTTTTSQPQSAAKASEEDAPAAVQAASEAKEKQAVKKPKARKRVASRKSTSRKSSSSGGQRARSTKASSRSGRSAGQARKTAAVAKAPPRKTRSTEEIMANAIADRHRHAL